MDIKNGIYMPIELKWSSITLPLKAGSPIRATGVVANNGYAIGLVPQTITVKPDLPGIYLLIGGEVSLPEVEASYDTLDKEAKAAMKGITFRKADGTIDDSSNPTMKAGGGITFATSSGSNDVTVMLAAATADSLGGVKVGEGLDITSGGVLSVAADPSDS